LSELLGLPKAAGLSGLAAEPAVQALLLALAAHSPFLWRLAVADVARLIRCLTKAPEDCLFDVLIELETVSTEVQSETEIMRLLRLARQEAALLIALSDLGGVQDVLATTEALSRAADVFISVALRHVLRGAVSAGRLAIAPEADLEAASGLVILALGKLGARELNYSSDVDLVVFYDPFSPALTGAVDSATLYARLTKDLVKLLQERTVDGYVARVDLRLRPDPGSTAVAIGLPAAYSYYESLGQNWERAAFIKARPVAGDKVLGETFLANLKPFIWRKYFDYAAIADVAAMKRQIHALRGHEEITVAGHDLKLGRGGIREIEFFVQTQQLIFGGKRARLRGSRTLDMLEELGREGWVTHDAVTDLRHSYLFLREIEHRLQMVADEQTQQLPSEPEALTRFAHFCGYARKSRFCSVMTHRLRLVSHHYGRLFEHAPRLDMPAGSLVFTGTADDPETLETLASLGFKEASLAAETIRGWHFGRRPAMRSARAREILTELTPLLLQSFARSGDTDAALAGFDAALAGMPAATELFFVLKSNPPICDLFAAILGGAPRLARTIISHPHVLDAAIDPNVLKAPLDDAAFRQRAGQVLQPQYDMEEFLDALRDFAKEELFPIGLRLWSGLIEPATAALAYSGLAASIVEAALRRVEEDFAAKHGLVSGGRVCVLALGKLGSREMTAASDLDLILIYDFDRDHPESTGPRPLHALQYYIRFAQRLISALTVATRRGRLYEVDMRLRPSGRKGPLATQFLSFAAYQAEDAESWEHMSLTRARVIAGEPHLGALIDQTIRAVLTRPRGAGLAQEVKEMRALIAREKGDSDPWDLKLAAGGLIDIEFIAQYLLLRHAHASPSLIHVSPCDILATAASAGLLAGKDMELLIRAHRLFSDVTQILQLSLDPGKDPRQANRAVKERLSKLAGVGSLGALESDLAKYRAEVRACFERILSPRYGA